MLAKRRQGTAAAVVWGEAAQRSIFDDVIRTPPVPGTAFWKTLAQPGKSNSTLGTGDLERGDLTMIALMIRRTHARLGPEVPLVLRLPSRFGGKHHSERPTAKGLLDRCDCRGDYPVATSSLW